MFNIFYCGPRPWDSTPWLERTGSDIVGVKKMQDKAQIFPLFVENVYCGAANILKQEMLSLGGEVSVHKLTINCKQEYTHILILGTLKEYKLLIAKLKAQIWKLKDLSGDIKIVLENLEAIGQYTPRIINGGEIKYKILKPSLNLARDLRDYPLTSLHTCQEPICLEANSLWSNNMDDLQEYILGLQSKGYLVAIQSIDSSQTALCQYLGVNFIISE